MVSRFFNNASGTCTGQRLTSVCAGLAVILGLTPTALALTPEERRELDLSNYTVTDPNASYFDRDERIELLQTTDNSLLIQQRDELAHYGPSCKQRLDLPPITENMRIPGFYPTPDAWELATEPLFQFEDTVSEMAGSYVASGDSYYAECLVKFLDNWAKEDALLEFHYHWMEPQAWFSLESMIFAAGMAYSVVRHDIDDMPERQERVEDWLNRIATEHMSIEGAESSCCNNHFYRRALYATMVGVLTEDDEMFQFGVSAIYSALHDMTPEGAFPMEMERGRRATHYQNYALLYLITNMEIIARQGYDIYELEIDGKTIHDAVDFLATIMNDPDELGDLAPSEQYTGFMKDPQYFSWVEIYRDRFNDDRFQKFVDTLRPIYNRSAGGYTTLYFMDPEVQDHIVNDEERQESVAFEGLQDD